MTLEQAQREYMLGMYPAAIAEIISYLKEQSGNGVQSPTTEKATTDNHLDAVWVAIQEIRNAISWWDRVTESTIQQTQPSSPLAQETTTQFHVEQELKCVHIWESAGIMYDQYLIYQCLNCGAYKHRGKILVQVVVTPNSISQNQVMKH